MNPCEALGAVSDLECLIKALTTHRCRCWMTAAGFCGTRALREARAGDPGLLTLPLTYVGSVLGGVTVRQDAPMTFRSRQPSTLAGSVVPGDCAAGPPAFRMHFLNSSKGVLPSRGTVGCSAT